MQQSKIQLENEILQEYNKIDNNWLSLHYKISIATVIFVLAVECILSPVFIYSDILTTTVSKYIIKFIVVPSGINFLCIAVATAVMRSDIVSQKFKIYAISIIYAIICFVSYTAHSAFTVTYFIFSGAIILTTIYASYSVTFSTACISISLFIISEVFVFWDVDKASIFESTLRLGNFLVSLLIIFALSAVCMIIIQYEQKKNTASINIEKERIMLHHRLKLDEVTGIYNRKALHDTMRDLEEDSKGKYIFAIIDIDNFKTINDSFGHQIGDKCLVEFAGLLKEHSEKAVPFRYGGDEFCLLFHNSNIEEAVKICEQIKSKLNSINLSINSDLKVTASFGLTEYEDEMNAAKLFVCADQALYKAKVERNSIQVFKKELMLMKGEIINI